MYQIFDLEIPSKEEPIYFDAGGRQKASIKLITQDKERVSRLIEIVMECPSTKIEINNPPSRHTFVGRDK